MHMSGIVLPQDVVSKKGTISRAPVFMHSSIPPMIDVRVLIHTGFFQFSKNMGTNQTGKRFYLVKIKGLVKF